MAIYIDKKKSKFGKMVMCHMLADSIEELHSMANKLGLKPSWFQNRKTPHYDICKSMRLKALAYGAIEISNKETVQIIKRWKNKQT